MLTTDLFIIAAGKGSRLGGNVPKALVPITNGEPNLTTTIKQIAHKFRNVFVVTNENIQDQWIEYFNSVDKYTFKNVRNIPIISGLGDGHAAIAGMKKVDSLMSQIEQGTWKKSDEIVICWGDVFIQHATIVNELLSQFIFATESGVIPAVKKENPYVTLLVDKSMKCLSADFSKLGENHQSGFHDQSIFKFKQNLLEDALANLHCSLWKNGRYATQSGELSLLFTFHYLYNIGLGMKVYETDYPTLSFNTIEEVSLIQSEINEKWKIHQP